MHKILIADDEEMIRELVKVTLSRDPSFEILIARNGAEALQRALETEPDLAILDIRMPEMTGLEVCRAIRAQGTEGPYILMLTAMGQVSDIQAGKDAGANDYMIKPFSPANLLTKVYEILEKAA